MSLPAGITLQEATTQPEIRFGCSGVNWQLVADTLRDVGMAHYAQYGLR